MSATGWSMKKILGFRWSKKAKITLETISFYRNISFSIFRYFFQYFQVFSIFICNESLQIKSYQFFKIYKRFYKKREKHSYSSQWEQKNWEKLDFVNYNSYFIALFYSSIILESFKMKINHFFSSIGLFVHKIFFISQARLQCNFRFLISGWRKKYRKGKLRNANS